MYYGSMGKILLNHMIKRERNQCDKMYEICIDCMIKMMVNILDCNNKKHNKD